MAPSSPPTPPLRSPTRCASSALAAFGGGTGWIVLPEMGGFWGPTETAILSVLEGEAEAADALAAAEQAVTEALVDIRSQ